MKTYTIVFSSPLRKTYEVEADCAERAFALASDMAAHRYPGRDFSDPMFSIDGIPMKLKK